MINIGINKHVIERIRARSASAATRMYRDGVYKMFNELLTVSYQFSGDFTSNWRIVVSGDALPSYDMFADKLTTARSGAKGYPGNWPAIDAALSRQPRSSLKFKFGDKVSFYNPTPLEFTGTTVTGEDGTKPLRPVNVIGNGILLKTYMQRKFRTG